MKHSASLCNSSGSPGWSQEEVHLLQKAIMKFGLGDWTSLLAMGYLPGKTVSQLNNQVRRMLGQQSSAEYAGLHIDVLAVGEANRKIKAFRKSGVLVNTGNRATREEVAKKIEANRQLYELPPSVYEAIQLDVVDKCKQQQIIYFFLLDALLRQRLAQLQQLKQELTQTETEIKALVGGACCCIDDLVAG